MYWQGQFNEFQNYTQDISELMNQYIETRTDDPNLFESNVIDDDNLNDWNIDDFLVALPKVIVYGINDNEFEFVFKYRKDIEKWSVGYINDDFKILEETNIDKYECFKQLYIKLKTLNKL